MFESHPVKFVFFHKHSDEHTGHSDLLLGEGPLRISANMVELGVLSFATSVKNPLN